jgi:purine nucleoside permease
MRRAIGLAMLWALAAAGQAPKPVRVVVVAMFEPGADTGDQPGELNHWVEREGLSESIPFPAGDRPLRANREGTVLAVVTGQGVANAAAVITALGMDGRFDFRQTYWLVAGIAGVDPRDASLASVAWARWVVDGDLAYEIDAREMPKEWPYGMLAIGAQQPNRLPAASRGTDRYVVFPLNAGLAEWAYGLTKDLKLPDTPGMAEFRRRFEGMPNAQRAPFVLLGDALGSSTYWHGARLTEWANDWMRLWTGGEANFVMTNMEDNGTAMALRRLTALGKADDRRLLVLRSASNYSQPPSGQDVEWSRMTPSTAFLPSLESAWMVGSRVVRELTGRWAQYAERTPGGAR